MNIRLGIYEVFSRIIPGGLYIVAIGQFLSILGLIHVDLQTLNSLSLLVSVALIVAAYLLGGAFDNLAMALFRLLKQRGFSGRRLEEFKRRHQDRWQIDLKDKDWPVLLAFIRMKNLELASDLERHNALSIMLRNVTLGILLLAADSLIQSLLSRNPVNIFVCVALIVLSLFTMREALKFREWFYDGIFETVLAFRLDLEEMIKPARPKRYIVKKG